MKQRNKTTKSILRGQKGFTLIELIVVIAILAVVAAIAVPALVGNINNARKKADISNAKQIGSAIAQVMAEDDAYVGISTSAETEFQSYGSTAKDVRNLIDDAIKKLQSVPVQKYKNAGNNFKVTIDDSGIVKVYVAGVTISGSGGTSSTATSIELFPNTDTSYLDN